MIDESEVNIAVSLDYLRVILGLPDCGPRSLHNAEFAINLPAE